MPWRQKDEEMPEEDLDYESGSQKELMTCERELEQMGEEHKENRNSKMQMPEEDDDEEVLQYDEEMEEEDIFADEFGEDEISEMGISDPSKDFQKEGGSQSGSDQNEENKLDEEPGSPKTIQDKMITELQKQLSQKQNELYFQL